MLGLPLALASHHSTCPLACLGPPSHLRRQEGASSHHVMLARNTSGRPHSHSLGRRHLDVLVHAHSHTHSHTRVNNCMQVGHLVPSWPATLNSSHACKTNTGFACLACSPHRLTNNPKYFQKQFVVCEHTQACICPKLRSRHIPLWLFLLWKNFLWLLALRAFPGWGSIPMGHKRLRSTVPVGYYL